MDGGAFDGSDNTMALPHPLQPHLFTKCIVGNNLAKLNYSSLLRGGRGGLPPPTGPTPTNFGFDFRVRGRLGDSKSSDHPPPLPPPTPPLPQLRFTKEGSYNPDDPKFWIIWIMALFYNKTEAREEWGVGWKG